MTKDPSDRRKITRALLSVSDKTRIVDFAKHLTKHKVKILSTGGTFKALKSSGVPVEDVATHTAFPEIMNGRVKTLHPKIHGGILADRNDENHLLSMRRQGILPIDMVVVNLYPFVQVVRSGASLNDCIETIDIGGPSMIRSAAKNYAYVTAVTGADQYGAIIEEMGALDGCLGAKTRRSLALKAFNHTAQYDAHIATWMSAQTGEVFPETLFAIGRRKTLLSHGENPHQKAGLYVTDSASIGACTAKKMQGKALSYNNINDANAAFHTVCEHLQPTCAIIKHASPCGVATAIDAQKAFKGAFSCDTSSAFGGVVAFNCPVSAAAAAEITKIFVEVIIAPKFHRDALHVLRKFPNIRVLETGSAVNLREGAVEQRWIDGGILMQSRDSANIVRDSLTVVTKRQPTERELENLLFANKVSKHAKSNAIIYARNLRTVGIGQGQPSRLQSAKFGAEQSTRFLGTQESVVASDAFFPFKDALEVCIDAGATAVIQPGGSKNDNTIIKTADDAGVAMVLTHKRCFKH